jgi:hypothetical protein
MRDAPTLSEGDKIIENGQTSYCTWSPKYLVRRSCYKKKLAIFLCIFHVFMIILTVFFIEIYFKDFL